MEHIGTNKVKFLLTGLTWIWT